MKNKIKNVYFNYFPHCFTILYNDTSEDFGTWHHSVIEEIGIRRDRAETRTSHRNDLSWSREREIRRGDETHIHVYIRM